MGAAMRTDDGPAELSIGTGIRPAAGAWTADMVFNTLMTISRSASLGGGAGFVSDRGRDLDKECGYPVNPTPENYKHLYQRGDIAARVVDLWPKECWKMHPIVYETEDEEPTAFEEDWDDLQQHHKLYSALQRLDSLAGVGRYGVMFLGFPDGRPEAPAPGYKAKAVQLGPDVTTVLDGWADTPPTDTELLYVRVYDETLVEINNWDTNRASPRYMQPTSYRIRTIDPKDQTGQGGNSAAAIADSTMVVHWTRIIHFADNKHSSETFGNPRMEVVLNRLLDLRKVVGGSGEMFYKGGFPGLSFESDPRYQDGVLDEEGKAGLRSEFQAYSEGLQRYLAVVGFNVKTLAPNVADPTAHVAVNMEMISVTLGVPGRILKGSEAAHQASTQDQKEWNARVKGRQLEVCEPSLLRPLVDRLLHTGCLTPPVGPAAPKARKTARKARQVWHYLVEWPALDTSTDDELADVMLKKTQALSAYVGGNVASLVPPLEFLTKFMELELDEAVAILEATLDQILGQQNNEPVAGLPAPPTEEEIAAEAAMRDANIEATKAKAVPNGKAPAGPPAMAGAKAKPKG